MYLKLLFSIVVFMAFSLGLFGRNVYVSTKGNDLHPGTFEQPIASIQKGLNILQPGDTLFIRGGSYYIKDQLKFKNSGIKNKWIVVTSYKDERVGIHADEFLKNRPKNAGMEFYNQGSLQIEGVKYVKVNGLNILYSHMAGIMVYGKKTSNITIENCRIFSSYNSGIGLWYTDSVKVLHCEVVDANNQDHRPLGTEISREAPHEAISVAGTTNFEVAYNYLHNCSKEGIDVKEFSAFGKVHHNYLHDILREGLYIDSWFGLLHDVEVYYNVVHHCDWGILVSSEGKKSEMKNVYIHDNLCYKNYSMGISFSTIGNDEPRSKIYVYNNTCYMNGTPGHWNGKAGGLSVVSHNLKDIYIYNNILYKNHAFEIATFDYPQNGLDSLKSRNIVIENNLIGEFHEESAFSGFFRIPIYASNGQNCIVKDPLFVDEKDLDFSLRSDSPARGKSKKILQNEYENLGAQVELFAKEVISLGSKW